jgi:hypothetical protein
VVVRDEGHNFIVDWLVLGMLVYKMMYGKTPGTEPEGEVPQCAAPGAGVLRGLTIALAEAHQPHHKVSR